MENSNCLVPSCLVWLNPVLKVNQHFIISFKVAALLTTRPEEITQITIERNASGLQVKPKPSRKLSVDSDSEPESATDDKSFRNRSISLFSRRHVRRHVKSTSTENHSAQNGESAVDINGKKISKPAMRSNSLPRRYSTAQIKYSKLHVFLCVILILRDVNYIS